MFLRELLDNYTSCRLQRSTCGDKDQCTRKSELCWSLLSTLLARCRHRGVGAPKISLVNEVQCGTGTEWSKLPKAMSRRLVGAQIGRGASENGLTVVFPNVESIVNSRVESDTICSVNHLGEAKDVGDVIGIIVNFAEGWDLSFEGQSASASIGVHGYGSLGWVNVSNEVWITDCAVNARARV